MNQLSYVHGASDKPLIGRTIGRFFDEACARHAQREALVVRPRTCGDLRGVKLKVDALACALMASGSRRATASASGSRTISNGR